MSNPFRVGDIVIGKPNNGHGVTDSRTKIRVTRLFEYDGIDFFDCMVLEGEYTGDTFDHLDINKFVLVISSLTNTKDLPLDTLLKRANLGLKAINELLDRFPDEAIVTSDMGENMPLNEWTEKDEDSILIVKKDIS